LTLRRGGRRSEEVEAMLAGAFFAMLLVMLAALAARVEH
jgi:hypothetical protein